MSPVVTLPVQSAVSCVFDLDKRFPPHTESILPPLSILLTRYINLALGTLSRLPACYSPLQNVDSRTWVEISAWSYGQQGQNLNSDSCRIINVHDNIIWYTICSVSHELKYVNKAYAWPLTLELADIDASRAYKHVYVYVLYTIVLRSRDHDIAYRTIYICHG